MRSTLTLTQTTLYCTTFDGEHVENHTLEANYDTISMEGPALLALVSPSAGPHEEIQFRQSQFVAPIEFSGTQILSPSRPHTAMVHDAFHGPSTLQPPSCSPPIFNDTSNRPSVGQLGSQDAEDTAFDQNHTHSPNAFSQSQTNGLPVPSEPQVVTGVMNGKIQFHDVVRISGGLACKPKHHSKPKHPSCALSIERTPFDQHRKRSLETDTEGFHPGSPLRKAYNMTSSEPAPTYLHATPNTSRHTTLTDDSTTLPSARVSSFGSSRSTKLSPPVSPASPSPMNHRPRLLRQASGQTFARRASISESTTGSIMASTIASRSTSPASSIYAPLRVPVVRAPAPFFGPTAERVARVRERRKVAERDAERAKGGWKAWWNNWFYQTDDAAIRKGKMHPAHDHEHHCARHEQDDEDDSDDGSCYHDVVLEHERSRLERRLKKLKKAALRPAPRSHPTSTSPRATEPDSSTLAWLGLWWPHWWSSPSPKAILQPTFPTINPPPKPVCGILYKHTGIVSVSPPLTTSI